MAHLQEGRILPRRFVDPEMTHDGQGRRALQRGRLDELSREAGQVQEPERRPERDGDQQAGRDGVDPAPVAQPQPAIAQPVPSPPTPGYALGYVLTSFSLSGVVTERTAAGQTPLEDVTVYCDACGPVGHSWQVTDKDGRYSFHGDIASGGGVWLSSNSATPLFVEKAGFVALLQLVFVAFPERHDVYEPLMWVLAAGSMTFGNLVALRQTNIVRLLAYSGIAQAGYMLAPLVVVGRTPESDSAALQAIVTYLAIYAAPTNGCVAHRRKDPPFDRRRG